MGIIFALCFSVHPVIGIVDFLAVEAQVLGHFFDGLVGLVASINELLDQIQWILVFQFFICNLPIITRNDNEAFSLKRILRNILYRF